MPTTLIFSLIALLIGITVHEFAHAWMANYLGDPTARYEGRVSLNPIVHLDPVGTLMIVVTALAGMGFGWGKPVPYNPRNLRDPKRGSLLIAIAGPIANLICALIFSLVYKIFGFIPNTFLGNLFDYVILLNISLMVFNLLPVPPLDGSKVLAALVPDEYQEYVHQYFMYGPLILFFLVFLGRGFLSEIIWPIIMLIWGFMKFQT